MTDPDAEIIEILASSSHTQWHRADRWNATTDGGRPIIHDNIKAAWRAEARAQLSALRRHGYDIGRL